MKCTLEPNIRLAQRSNHNKSKCGKTKVAVPSNDRIHLNEKHLLSLNKLIDQVISASILAYPDYNETCFCTDDNK